MTNANSVRELLGLVGVPTDYKFDAVFYALGRQDCIHAFNPHLARSMGLEENPCSSLSVLEFCTELLESLKSVASIFNFKRDPKFFYLGPGFLDETERLSYRVNSAYSLSRVGPKGLHAAFSICVEDLYLKEVALTPEERRARDLLHIPQPRLVKTIFLSSFLLGL